MITFDVKRISLPSSTFPVSTSERYSPGAVSSEISQTGLVEWLFRCHRTKGWTREGLIEALIERLAVDGSGKRLIQWLVSLEGLIYEKFLLPHDLTAIQTLTFLLLGEVFVVESDMSGPP